MADIIDAIIQLRDNFSPTMNDLVRNLDRSSREIDRNFTYLNRAGQSLTSIGTTLSATVTAPLLGIGIASVNTFAEFEENMAKVQAISGATGEELNNLENIALNLGATTSKSASEVVEAFQFMAMAGWEPDEIEAGIEGVVNLAIASGEELSLVSDIITGGISAFGDTADDAGRWADVLAAVSSSSSTSVAQLGEAFRDAGSIAGTLGFSLEDVAVAAGLMANGSISGSVAGTALSNIMKSLTDDIEIYADSIGTVVVSTQDANGQMLPLGQTLQMLRQQFSRLTQAEQAQAAESIVGADALAGFLAIMNASQEDFDQLTQTVNDAAGTSKNMADIMADTLNGSIDGVKAGIEALAISIGRIMLPYVESAVKWFGSLVDRFNQMTPAQQQTIVTMLAFVAVFPPIILGIGKLITAIVSIIKVFASIKTAIVFIGGLFSSFGGVVSSVGSIISGVFSGVVSLVSGAIGVFTKFFALLKVGFTAVAGLIGTMTLPISLAISAVMVLITWFVNAYKQAGSLGGAIELMGIQLANFFINIGNGVIGFVQGAVNIVTGLINKVLGMIKDVNILGFTPFDNIGEIPKLDVPRFETIDIPQYATGTSNHPGGMAMINEIGGEIVDLPTGSRVYPHDDSVLKAYQDGQMSLIDSVLNRTMDIDHVQNSVNHNIFNEYPENIFNQYISNDSDSRVPKFDVLFDPENIINIPDVNVPTEYNNTVNIPDISVPTLEYLIPDNYNYQFDNLMNSKPNESLTMSEKTTESIITNNTERTIQTNTSGSPINNFNIAKLAESIVVREDADIDRIANQLFNKLRNESFRMA